MRGLHPRTPVLFSSCWNTTLCSAGKGKHRAAFFPSCCWSGSARRPRFPLDPFPRHFCRGAYLTTGIPAPNRPRRYFFSPPQRGKAKKSSSRAGHNPAPRPACKAYSVFDLPVIAPTRRTAQAPARCLREKIVKCQLCFFKFLRFNKFVVVAFP